MSRVAQPGDDADRTARRNDDAERTACHSEAFHSEASEQQLPDLLYDALLAAIRGPHVWCATPTDFLAFLVAHRVDPLELERRHIDVGVLRTRYALYRDLVHRRVRGVLDGCLPRTLLALGSELDLTLEHFCTACPWPSPHLRDLVADFVRFGCDRWSTSPTGAPHVADLSRYELARLEVASALDDTPLELSDVSPEVTIGLRDATRFLKLHYPVHLSAPPQHPAPVGAYHVLLYRDPSNDVSTIELSELAAHVLGALRHGLPLARAAEHGLTAAGLPLTAENLADVANLLNELFTRRVFRRQPSSASN